MAMAVGVLPVIGWLGCELVRRSIRLCRCILGRDTFTSSGLDITTTLQVQTIYHQTSDQTKWFGQLDQKEPIQSS